MPRSLRTVERGAARWAREARKISSAAGVRATLSTKLVNNLTQTHPLPEEEPGDEFARPSDDAG